MAPRKTRYRCRACNWRFSRVDKPTTCTYCGKASVSVDAEQGAEELLNEIRDSERPR